MCLSEAPASTTLGLEHPCAEGSVDMGGTCNSTIAQCGTNKDLFYERTECHNDRACSACDNYGLNWGGVCLMKLGASELPANCNVASTLGKCDAAAVDAICEADGELNTDTALNQCGENDFYRRVTCDNPQPPVAVDDSSEDFHCCCEVGGHGMMQSPGAARTEAAPVLTLTITAANLMSAPSSAGFGIVGCSANFVTEAIVEANLNANGAATTNAVEKVEVTAAGRGYKKGAILTVTPTTAADFSAFTITLSEQHKFNSDISLARLDASSNPSASTSATGTGNGVCRKYASMSSLSSASAAAAGAPPLHSNYQTKWATVTDQRPLVWSTPDADLSPKSRVATKPEDEDWRREEVKGVLPAEQVRAELDKALEFGKVVIVSGGTGSGKSTQLPQYFLDA